MRDLLEAFIAAVAVVALIVWCVWLLAPLYVSGTILK